MDLWTSYIGKTKFDDYDEEKKENDRLSFELVSKKGSRFFSSFGKNWYCDVCGERISTYQKHYHCFECKNYDLCVVCHSVGKGHLHENVDFLYELNEPNFFFTSRMKEDENQTVSSLIIKCFEYFSNRHFIGTRENVKVPYSWSKFSEIYELVKRLAIGMRDLLGLKKGDMISIHCDVRIEPILTWFACMFLGVAFVPLQSVLTKEQKIFVLQQTDVKCVFCGDSELEEIIELCKECISVKQIVLISKSSEKLEKTNNDNSSPSPFFCHLFSDIIEKSKNIKSFSPVQLKPNDIVCIIYTSGTTGLPKGIVFRERRWLVEISGESQTLPLVVLSILPYSHISGIYQVFLCFCNGGRVGLLTQSDMNNLFPDFRDICPSVLSTVPRILNFVYAEFQRRVRNINMSFSDNDERQNKVLKIKEEMENVFGDRLIKVHVGSAHCSAKVKQFIRDLTKLPVYDGYGLSEVGSITSDYEVRENIRVKLVDCPSLGYFSTDTPYPRGELLVKNLLKEAVEYFKVQIDPSKFDSEGYLSTGDIVEKRGNRYIVIDRKNNILKLAHGEFVSLENIELALENSKFVDQVVLFASPEKTCIVGLVSPRGDSNIHLEDIEKLKQCQEEVMKDLILVSKSHELNSWEYPSSIRLVFDGFPLTELKKKNRRMISQKYNNLLLSMFEEVEMKSETQEQKTSKNGGNFLNDLGIHFDISDHKMKDMKLSNLGVQSFTGVIIRNQIEQVCGEKLSFSEVMNLPVSKIYNLLQPREEIEEVEGEENNTISNNVPRFSLPKFIDLETEKKKFREFFEYISGKYPAPNDHSQRMNKWITKPRCLLLTGSSGFLGKCILEHLYVSFPNTKILCLVRKKSTECIPSSEEIVGDLSKVRFGFNEVDFDRVFINRKKEEEIDLIIHCGAMVNHFADYSDHYDTNVRSLYDIVRIAKGYKPIIYISTISVFHRMHIPLEEQKIPSSYGYAGSKWVADCLLRSIDEKKNILTIRPNLILGDTRNGRCNSKDWLTAIVSGCVSVNSIPVSGTELDIPLNALAVNYLSKTIVEMIQDILMFENNRECNISFKNITIRELMGFLYEIFSSQEMKKIGWEEWISKLEKLVGRDDVSHPISPFLLGLKKSGKIGSSKFIGFNTQSYENFRKDWKKANVDDLKEFVKFISKSLK